MRAKRFNINTNKPLFFWGLGSVCKMIIEEYPEIKVRGFIDSNYDADSWKGIPVLKPDSISDWSDKYIVITTKFYHEEIKEYLKKRNLLEGEDYMEYMKFLDINEPTVENTLSGIKKRVNSEELVGSNVIYAPVFFSRVSSKLVNYFKEYAKHRSNKDFVLLTWTEIFSEQRAGEIMGFPVIRCLSEEDHRSIIMDSSYLDGIINPNNKVIQYVVELERQIVGREFDGFHVSRLLRHYAYYREIINLINPKSIIIWGGFRRDHFFLQHMAEELHIPCTFMEHGYIPGTIQCDKIGLGGSGEIGKGCLDHYNIIRVNNVDEEYSRVRAKILESKMDTGLFRKIESDEKQIQMLDKNRRTVFLVGMGVRTWDVKEGSPFWKEEVSSEFETKKEAYEKTKELCKQNDWNLIYKPHPGEKDEFCNIDLNTHGIAIVRLMSIDEILYLSDIVVALETNVSYKALLYEKALVEIGKYNLLNMGCSYEVHGDYEEKLIEAMKKGMTDNQKKNFAEHVIKLLHYSHWDDLTHLDVPYGRPIMDNIL